LLRQAFEANPPPLVKGRRLKLFYVTQTSGKQVHRSEERVVQQDRDLQVPEFVLFVNDPSLLNETYRRYLEGRIRKTKPYPGLPIILTLRQRTGMRHNKQR
jgi:GTP-binding protein